MKDEQKISRRKRKYKFNPKYKENARKKRFKKKPKIDLKASLEKLRDYFNENYHTE